MKKVLAGFIFKVEGQLLQEYPVVHVSISSACSLREIVVLQK